MSWGENSIYGAILQEKVSEIEVTKGEIRAKDLELKVLRNRVQRKAKQINETRELIAYWESILLIFKPCTK